MRYPQTRFSSQSIYFTREKKKYRVDISASYTKSIACNLKREERQESPIYGLSMREGCYASYVSKCHPSKLGREAP